MRFGGGSSRLESSRAIWESRDLRFDETVAELIARHMVEGHLAFRLRDENSGVPDKVFIAEVEYSTIKVDAMAQLLFEEWQKEFDDLARADGYEEGSYVENCGKEDFEEACANGMSPQEAWDEEKSAARALGCF